MYRTITIALWPLLFLVACGPAPRPALEQVAVYPTYQQLSARLAAAPDTTFVLNYWATTCPPCRREMPLLDQLAADYAQEPVQVITVSMDEAEHAQTRVLSFIRDAAPHTEALLMADPNRTRWTAEVDTSWYGALPATLVLRGEARLFHFGAFPAYDTLTNWLKPLLPAVSAGRH